MWGEPAAGTRSLRLSCILKRHYRAVSASDTRTYLIHSSPLYYWTFYEVTVNFPAHSYIEEDNFHYPMWAHSSILVVDDGTLISCCFAIIRALGCFLVS